MGSVWVADHLALKTQVVVKFMSPELAASPDAVARFSREAAAAAQIKSPHVVQMLDHGITADQVPFIAMELLEGQDLAHRLTERGGRLPLPEIADIVGQVAKALGRAHERGIVHRDIKPENIFLCEAGGGETFVKLVDFGIAKSTEGGGSLGNATKTGSTIGTPYYMSPEQLVGSRSLDSRSDLWSLGIVAYQAAVGTKPFDAETLGALVVIIHTAILPTPSHAAPDLPASFDAWFAKACAKDPAARFSTAKELADALAAVARGERWSAPPLPTQRGTVAIPALAASNAPLSSSSAPIPAGSGPVIGAAPVQVLGAAPLAGNATDGGIGLRTQPVPVSTVSRGATVIGLAVVALAGAGIYWFTHRPAQTDPRANSASPSIASVAPSSSAPAAPTAAPTAPPAVTAPDGSSSAAVTPATATPSASASATPHVSTAPAGARQPLVAPQPHAAPATKGAPLNKKRPDDIF
jgi:serine/threonine-protein kinase